MHHSPSNYSNKFYLVEAERMRIFGRYRKAIENYKKSIEYFKQILHITNDSKNLYYNIACLYSKMGETDEAISWLKKAIGKGYG